MRILWLLLLAVASAVAQTGTWNYQNIYSFQGGADGGGPGGLVIGPQGIYGTLSSSGQYGGIFLLTPPAALGGQWTETTLYNFQGGADGNGPAGPLTIGSNGEIYGTTMYGGLSNALCGYGCGTVFQLTPPAAPAGAWTETVLYRFQGPPDAYNPVSGAVVGPDGSLFGTTEEGGSQTPPPSGNGAVYQLTPPAAAGGAWTETVIHSFSQSGPAGCDPVAGLTLGANGVLYGSTDACSTPTIFSLTPPAVPGGGWTMSLIREFGTAGALAMDADGRLYAAAYNPLLQLTPPAVPGGNWSQVILHVFGTGGGRGAELMAGPALGADGAVYGTTFWGGASDSGLVYQLLPPNAAGGSWTENVLYSFVQKDFGAGGLPVIVGPSGALYGVSFLGAFSEGAVFELTRADARR